MAVLLVIGIIRVVQLWPAKRLISQVGLEVQVKFEEYKAKLNSESKGQ